MAGTSPAMTNHELISRPRVARCVSGSEPCGQSPSIWPRMATLPTYCGPNLPHKLTAHRGMQGDNAH
jgi:hypothetical protein